MAFKAFCHSGVGSLVRTAARATTESAELVMVLSSLRSLSESIVAVAIPAISATDTKTPMMTMTIVKSMSVVQLDETPHNEYADHLQNRSAAHHTDSHRISDQQGHG